MATFYEKKPLSLGVGEEVKHYDDGKDGYPEKWVNGIVQEVGDECFTVLWDDFKELGWETEYEWNKVTIEGNRIFENGQRKKLKDDINPAYDDKIFGSWGV